MADASRKNRRPKVDLVVLDDDEPQLKITKGNPESIPAAPDVVELQQKLAKAEKKIERLIKIAGDAQSRVEFLESLIDKKPNNADDTKKVEELETKGNGLTTEMEEERRQADERIDKLKKKLEQYTQSSLQPLQQLQLNNSRNVVGVNGSTHLIEEIIPRIFLNKTFILTSANRTGDIAFKKGETMKKIIERGGVVVEDINKLLGTNAYLVSDKYYRTHKYLAAISIGIPCLSYKWVVECVARERLVPYHRHTLPAGVSFLNGEMYPLPDIRGKLLVGRSIMVFSKNSTTIKRGTMGFKQIWSPIVEVLGARLVSDASLMDDSPLPDFDVLLTDSACPLEVVQKVESAGTAVVSSEWMIQSIIMGACPHFSAHPRFHYYSGNE